MKKVALIIIVLCALVTTALPAQTCGPIEVGPKFPASMEFFVGDSARLYFHVDSGGTAPYTFYLIDAPPGAIIGAANGWYRHYLEVNESYTITVGVRDANGCTGSLLAWVTVMCNPDPNHGVDLEATKGVFYSQATPMSPYTKPPYTDFQAFDLPPGLSLSPTGVISGTPTAFGVFQSIVTYNGLGGCFGRTLISFTVHNNDLPTQSLWITPLCTQANTIRRWVVHNPNAIDVVVQWEDVFGNYGLSGSFVAHNGDNILYKGNSGWPNTVRIKWYDDTNTLKQIVQAANDDLCNPPACVEANGVTFYHAGLQRDLNTIEPAYLRNPERALGQPDGNDAPSNSADAVSLGYYGFITLKLSANLYDQPGPDLKVWEYSDGDPDYGINPERAEVFVSTDNSNWISLGYTNPTADCRSKLDWEFDLAGKATWCRYVKVLDRTYEWAWRLDPVTCLPTSTRAFNNQSNGFDLDAITCVTPTSGPPPNARISADTSSDSPSINDLDDSYPVLSPNPATSLVTFDLSREPVFANTLGVEVEISIVDMAGRRMQGRMHVLDEGLQASENIEELSPGFFVAQVRTKGFAKYYKFIKK
jgi:hypothetical protein